MPTQEENKIYFRSEEHRARFREGLRRMGEKAVYGGDRINQYYGSTLLVLSMHGHIWEDAQTYFTENGIGFERYLESGYFSTTERTMVQFAANMFNESNHGPDPVDLVALDTGNFEVCIQALRMRRRPYRLADIEA